MVVTIVSIGALIVVAAAVVIVFKMFLATQEAKFSSKEVGLLFAQLKDSLGEFRRAAEASQKENSGLGRELKVQLEEVGRKAASLGQQADEFVTALKGGNKIQGNWGEGILAKVLEDSGLVRGVNFREQEGSREDRPDVTVEDGLGHKIFIDAKVNITEFTAAMNAANEGRVEEADALMKRHAASVRAQVKNLAGKNYPKQLQGEEPVIMFMPSEATYSAAVRADPELIAFANAQKVAIATPQMLLSFLMLFRLGIVHQQVEKNNLEIGKRAQQILDRMDAAFTALDKVGKALDDATAKYHEALGKLGMEPGMQNIVTPAKDLIRLTESAEKRNSKLLQS